MQVIFLRTAAILLRNYLLAFTLINEHAPTLLLGLWGRVCRRVRINSRGWGEDVWSV